MSRLRVWSSCFILGFSYDQPVSSTLVKTHSKRWVPPGIRPHRVSPLCKVLVTTNRWLLPLYDALITTNRWAVCVCVCVCVCVRACARACACKCITSPETFTTLNREESVYGKKSPTGKADSHYGNAFHGKSNGSLRQFLSQWSQPNRRD